MKKLIALVLALPLLGCGSMYRFVTDRSRSAELAGPALDIVVKNVGQGQCLLIRAPGGRTAIIDGGLNRAIGTNVFLFLRDSLGTRHLDYAFASHYHVDHMGGLYTVLDSVMAPSRDSLVHGCYDRGYTSPDTFYANYIQTVGDKRRTIALGQEFDLGGGATLQCVCVNSKVISGDSTVPPPNYAENSYSIGLLVRYRDFKMIIGSDIGGGAKYSDVESILAPSIGRVNVLYVNHHGSAHSSNEYWLRTLRPQASVISCGADNPWGHPAVACIDRLAAAKGNRIYQTEKGVGDVSRQTIVNSNVWVRVYQNEFTVAGDRYPVGR